MAAVLPLPQPAVQAVPVPACTAVPVPGAVDPELSALSFVTAQGARVGGATRELATFAIDADLWAAAQKQKEKLHCFAGQLPRAAGGVACVPPLALHVFAFAPCLWIVPMLCNVCCCRFVHEPFPAHADRALVVTDAGVAGFGPGPGFAPQAIAWDAFRVQLNRYDRTCHVWPFPAPFWDDPLSCAVGAGLLCPCAAYVCFRPTTPGLYHARLDSIATVRRGGKKGRYVPVNSIDLVGLAASPDDLLAALRARSAPEAAAMAPR